MKKKYLCILLVLFLVGQTYSQNWIWTKNGISQGQQINDMAEGVCNTTDLNGNVIITGFFRGQVIFDTYTLNTSPNEHHLFVLKYDPNGNIQWVKNIGAGEAQSVSTDATGNIFVTGRFWSPTIVFGSYTLTNTGQDNLFIVKFDPNGNALWAKNSNAPDGAVFGNSVASDQSGNSIVGGDYAASSVTFASTIFTLTAPGFDALLVKYSSGGNFLWARSPLNGTNDDRGTSVCTDASGNIYFAGYFKSPMLTFGTTTLVNSGIETSFLTKYDPSGNVLWAISPNGSDNVAYAVKCDNTGNIYLTGNFSSANIVFGTYTLTNTGVSNFFIAKYDPSGNVMWAKSANGPGEEFGWSVNSYSSGIFVTGSYSTSVNLGSYTLTPSGGAPDPMFIFQLDLNGNVMNAISLDSGGDDWSTICFDQSCNMYLTGDYIPNPFIIGTQTLAVNLGKESVFTAKMNYCDPEGIAESSAIESGVRLFPNPNAGTFEVYCDLDVQKSELVVANLLGQRLIEQPLAKGINRIQCHGYVKGIYFYTMFVDGVKIKTGKIVME